MPLTGFFGVARSRWRSIPTITHSGAVEGCDRCAVNITNRSLFHERIFGVGGRSRSIAKDIEVRAKWDSSYYLTLTGKGSTVKITIVRYKNFN
ncbi:MAG: hypothetical protein QNJ54_22050 [Prochloraceae cyanobacterium]|nr:hypothetical protein [Prochloraceae cyanobacterium]